MNKKIITSIALSAVLASSLFSSDDLGNVVVTSKSKQSILDTAGSITVITQKDIKEMNASSIQDILEEVSGVNIGVNDSSFGGRQNISIRGADSSQSLILIDGKRISGSDAQIGHSDFQYNWLPLSAIKRIEVLRGPMSSLYGSKGIGGVINIITKKPDAFEGIIDVRYGRNSSDGEAEKSISLTIGGNITDNLGVSFFAEKKDDDLVANENGTGETEREGKDIKNGMLNVWFDIDDTQKLSASYLRGNEKRSNAIYNRTTSTYSVLDEYYDIDKEHYSIAYQKNFNDITLDLKYYVTKSDSHTNQYKYTHELKDTVFNAEVSSDIFDNNFIIAGIEKRTESYNKIYDDPTRAASNFEGEIDYKSAYIQDEITLGDNFILTLGSRYDKHEKFGGEFSPKANIVYKLNTNNRIKAGYGHGFNAPTLTKNSSLYTFSGQHVFHGNDDLKPESSDTFELGFEHQDKNDTFKVTVFHTKVTDLIDSSFIQVLPGNRNEYKYENVASATMDGLELEFEKKEIISNLDLKFNFNYLKTEDKETKLELVAKPSRKMNLKLSYAFPYDVNGNVRFKYVGSQFANASSGRYELGSYATVGFQLSKEFIRGLTTKIGVENLTDRQLNDDSNYSIKGRVVYVGLNYKF